MKIENIRVFGFEPAIRAMRNPMDSWDQSDSSFYSSYDRLFQRPGDDSQEVIAPEMPQIGPKDLDLALRLIKAGSDHRKFMRQIIIWWDITIPRYIWQELDTYKVATVRNSCSTMHKLGHRDLDRDDFEGGAVMPEVLAMLNEMGRAYRNNQGFQHVKGKELLAWMKRILPEGFLQKATYTFSYETGLNMYFARRSHRMPEWSGAGGICAHVLALPYFLQFTSVLK